jgi:transcription antitermination factor NusA-like protein
VKTQLCSICLKNYPLICENCQQKIDSGEITELGIKVARILVDNEEKFPALKDVTFKRVFQVNGVILIIVGHGDVRRILSSSRRVIRILEEKLNTNVRILEESRNPQHILQDLIRPVRILGINTIWLPDDSFERKVRISSRERSRIPLSLEQIEKVIHELTGERIRIAYD